MATFGNGDGEGQGPAIARIMEVPGLPGRSTLWIRFAILLAALVVLFSLLNILRGIFTNWLWFSHLGVREVYSTILFTRTWLFVAGLVVISVIVAVNYRIAYRNSWGPTAYEAPPQTLAWLRRMVVVSIVLMGAVVALSFATALSGRWEQFLKFMNSADFAIQDPVFGLDVGFHVFTMPMLHTVQGWLMGAAIVSLVTSASIYLVVYSLRSVSFTLTRPVLNHLAVASAFLMFTVAAAHWLDTYEILFSDSGTVVGATYADVTARLPALRLLAGTAALSGIVMLFTLRIASSQQAMQLFLAAFGLWVATAILAGAVWPGLIQRFSVDPNELERERPYIERNIEWTRLGFDIERVEERSYDVQTGTLSADLANNPDTVGNIRLWDPRPLLDVYNQIQHLRLYYSFLDPDIDRYVIDGEYRQVLLGTRELIQDGLDDSAQNWVNRRLVYTHGYGVVMSPATDFTEGGQPEFFLKDVPPVGKVELTQPRVYYGEGMDTRASQAAGLPRSDDVVIVNTLEPEFDRPTDEPGGQPIFIDRYEGTGGVHLSSLFRRAAYAWEFADVNLLISGQLTEESRVLYRRHIRERVTAIAPFLRYDRDPYMVVHEGRLFWMQDAYTTTDRLPYSRRVELPADATGVPFLGLNYIRNSVKVVIDAYNGDVTFYSVGPEGSDPVLEVFKNAFPGLFVPISEMPEGLLSHIRYPEVLLRVQASTFLQYHMTEPKEFFLKEDQWEIPNEVILEGETQEVQPYYIIMKLPGEEEEEFVLILPFTPQDKPNLVAWIAARSDGDHYGDILLFVFPADRLFNGPAQIEARIDNDPRISEQFTLWGQSGSIVIRGNLLVIPIGESLLYAEPVYLQADSLDFPELKRVILATSDRVVMEPTLDKAITALLDGRPRSVPSNGEPVLGGIPPEELRRELDALRDALDALREGVDGVGAAVDGLGRITRGDAP